MTEKIYLLLYIVALLIIGVQTIVFKESYGDAEGMNLTLDRTDLSILLVICIFAYLFVYILYSKSRQRLWVVKKMPKYQFNQTSIHKYIFIFMLIKLASALVWGVGVLNANVTTRISFLFNLIKIEEFMPIYYIIARDEKKKLYWVNIILFGILKVVQGWTGFLLQIFIFEMYFFEKKHKNFFSSKTAIFKVFVMVCFSFLFGGLIYKYFYQIKTYIRTGGLYNFSIFRISYLEALNKLVARLTYYPGFTALVQNLSVLKKLYSAQNIFLSEFFSFFKPLIPSFLFKNKNYAIIGLLVWQCIWKDLSGVSMNVGVVGYIIALAKCDILELLVWIIGGLFLFLTTSSILWAFDNEEHDIKILYFLFLISIVNNGSLQMNYAYSYIGAIYFIVILRLLGAIKVKKRG